MIPSTSGSLVDVDDVDLPSDPESELDALIAYIEGPFIESRKGWRDLVAESRQLKDRATCLSLGYECVLFRSELDPWLALAGQLYETTRGNELTVTNDERKDEKRRVTGEYLKAHTASFVAPLKRAMQELGDMQDLLSKTLSWCQTQQKSIAAEEYGDLYAGYNEVPERLFASTPTLGGALGRVKPK